METLQSRFGPVSLDRGQGGTPRICSSGLSGALFGLGYCHGRDRGLQLRLVRILARGRASEVLGAADHLIKLDRFFRRLNLANDADAEYGRMRPEVREGVDAYCDGVNSAFGRHGIPWELRWLGDRDLSDLWTFRDVGLIGLAIGYVTLAEGQGMVERFVVECIRNGVPRNLMEELFSPGALNGLDEGLTRRIRVHEPLMPEALWDQEGLPVSGGSNNWAVAGHRSISGFPLVANDPHLEVSRVPPFWYDAVLEWNEPGTGKVRSAAGLTLPGTPGIASGRTVDLAWSITYACLDAIDSWIEDCRDGKFRRGQEWVPFHVREETIRPKGQPPITLTFHENLHGTLQGDPSEPGLYLATRWSSAEGTIADAMTALWDILHASTVEDGMSILSGLRNGSWCLVLGDRSGSIGFQMTGKCPIRRPGATGLIPLPGWDPENDWRGFAAPEDLPRCVNPPEGFLVTANDDLGHLGNVPTINTCVGPDRGQRIREVLQGQEQVAITDMKALQYDLLSTQALKFLAILKPIVETMPRTPASRVLLDWDGRYLLESPAPLVFERFYRELIERVFGGVLGRSMIQHVLDHTVLLLDFHQLFDRILLAENSAWFLDQNRDDLYRAAWEGVAWTTIERYGKSRSFRARHLLLGGRLPGWLGFDPGPFEIPGSRATVFQGQIITRHGRRYACSASARWVTDLATDELELNLPGGVSDRRWSRWYADGWHDWMRGAYRTLKLRAEGS